MRQKPIITPTKNGPYRVKNCDILKGLVDGQVYDAAGTVALCRCGGSSNSPFCDGICAHAARCTDGLESGHTPLVGPL